jgi:putative hydrolases of HD superfamily
MDQACLKATLENSESIFEFILKLKIIPRAGWKKKAGITTPESVADHAYSVAAIAMILSDAKKLDTGKILKMALLHDLAESIVGDLTPEDASKSKKKQLEDSAMGKILSLFDAKTKKQYWSVWTQYQKNSTKEAKLLHDVDKLEMALQAKIYSKSHKREKLEPFFDSAKKQIRDADIKKILDRIS